VEEYMKLGEGITFHAGEEARKKWEGREKAEKERKCGCPSCDIAAMAAKARGKDPVNSNLSEEKKNEDHGE
jgi:hypothetical protein